jgi:hypothetical protein
MVMCFGNYTQRAGDRIILEDGKVVRCNFLQKFRSQEDMATWAHSQPIEEPK